jgi:formylglycine-generating enzyme required for sulfatase activity
MHGNVWEWCNDGFGKYPRGAVKDPRGSSEGSYRVLRGGSLFNDARYCKSAIRHWLEPSYRNSFLGFRLALSTSGFEADPLEAGAGK